MQERLDEAGTRARQHELYQDLWEQRSGEAFSPDLIRYQFWKPHLTGKIVDIGAGDGLLARSFPRCDIYSVDLTSTGLHRVAHKAAVGAADELPFASGAFDTVVLSEVLEHVANLRKVLCECRRVCAPNGAFLISVPQWPLSIAESLYYRRRIGSRPTLDNIQAWDPNHERRFGRQELLNLLRETGWHVHQVIPLFGEATSFAIYWLEPLMNRLRQRNHRYAQHLIPIDRWIGRRYSGLAVVASR